MLKIETFSRSFLVLITRSLKKLRCINARALEWNLSLPSFFSHTNCYQSFKFQGRPWWAVFLEYFSKALPLRPFFPSKSSPYSLFSRLILVVCNSPRCTITFKNRSTILSEDTMLANSQSMRLHSHRTFEARLSGSFWGHHHCPHAKSSWTWEAMLSRNSIRSVSERLRSGFEPLFTPCVQL